MTKTFKPSAREILKVVGIEYLIYLLTAEVLVYPFASHSITAAIVVTLIYAPLALIFIYTVGFEIRGNSLTYRRFTSPWKRISIPISNIERIHMYLTRTAPSTLWYNSLGIEYKPAAEERIGRSLEVSSERYDEPNILGAASGNLWRRNSKENVVRQRDVAGWDLMHVMDFLRTLKDINPDINFQDDYREIIETIGKPEAHAKAVATYDVKQKNINRGVAGLVLLFILFWVFLFAYQPQEGGWDFFRFFKVVIGSIVDFVRQ
ncbi:MAG: hypothetical protein Athens041674_575 [Parcubacteria group bacterium Athens0416_74]|nr:MAG: hypothetical protein Athens041674_575 [Parcubacteria group bacterium Athens0416_74]